MKLLGVFLLLCVGISTAEKVVCYFSSWAVYRPDEGSYDVDDIDPFLCTDLIFSFSGLNNQTWEIEVLDPWNELCPPEPGGDHCAYKRFVKLKEKNPSLTILLSVGGWNEGSEDYSVMADDPDKRSTFIHSTISLLTQQGFEGLDFDWEYPTQRGGALQDKENFITLLQEVKAAFDEVSPSLILTASVAAGKDIIDSAYDIERIEPLLDQVHVMAYDYHGCFENFTHHNAPLCGYYSDSGKQANYNVNFTVSYYLGLGVPKEKLIMGAPLYGRCYTLDNITDHGMLAPANNCGAPGPYVRIPGTLAANEICLRLQHDLSCSVVHDPNLNEPYFYCSSDNIWCGYDDADSLYLKARYAKNMGLGGVVIWTMDEDDFNAQCYKEPNHLINVIKNALEEPAGGDVLKCGEAPETTIETTLQSTPEPMTTMETTPEQLTTPDATTEQLTTPDTTTEQLTTPDATTEQLTTPDGTTEQLTTPEPETTTIPVITTTPHGGRPDCTGMADLTTFPHLDCDKYWECVFEEPVLQACAPGTLYDRNSTSCNFEDEVDTSQCRHWKCQVEGTKYPAEKCYQYYLCEHKAPLLRSCPPTLYWHQLILDCDDPGQVDTSLCDET